MLSLPRFNTIKYRLKPLNHIFHTLLNFYYHNFTILVFTFRFNSISTKAIMEGFDSAIYLHEVEYIKNAVLINNLIYWILLLLFSISHVFISSNISRILYFQIKKTLYSFRIFSRKTGFFCKIVPF